MAHTPGPWEWNGGYPQTVVGNDDGLVHIAETFYEPDAPPHPNLLLITAAPDLLAALEEHLRLWGPDQDMPSFNEAIEQARAAVAKARGQD